VGPGELDEDHLRLQFGADLERPLRGEGVLATLGAQLFQDVDEDAVGGEVGIGDEDPFDVRGDPREQSWIGTEHWERDLLGSYEAAVKEPLKVEGVPCAPADAGPRRV
jgi:hypothetical protein